MDRYVDKTTFSRRVGPHGLEIIRLQNTMPKPDHIFDLERRQQVLEAEFSRALSKFSADDPMVADLKRRMLHLKAELERFCNKVIEDRRFN